MFSKEELDKLEERVLSGKKLSVDEYKMIIRRKKVHLRSQLNMLNCYDYSNSIMDYYLEAITSDIVGDTKYLGSVCRYMMANLYQARNNRKLVLDDIEKMEKSGNFDNMIDLIYQYDEILNYDKLVVNLDNKVTNNAINNINTFNDPDCIKDELIKLEESKYKIKKLSKNYK